MIGIGLSVHGYVDPERKGPIVCPNTPALRGLDLRGLMEDNFGLPVVVNNDLTAHVLAEYDYGSGRGRVASCAWLLARDWEQGWS